METRTYKLAYAMIQEVIQNASLYLDIYDYNKLLSEIRKYIDACEKDDVLPY